MGGYVEGPLSGSVTAANDLTGWAQYTDTTYTSASRFTLATDTKVTLPNSGSKLAPQIPVDITDFYDSGTQKIIGRNGDGYSVGIEFKIVPDSVAASLVTVAIDIGGAIGEIYPSTYILDKGVGVVHNAYFNLAVYTLGTWEANGGDVKIVCNGPAGVYDIRYVFHRLHKAR